MFVVSVEVSRRVEVGNGDGGYERETFHQTFDEGVTLGELRDWIGENVLDGYILSVKLTPQGEAWQGHIYPIRAATIEIQKQAYLDRILKEHDRERKHRESM